MKFAVSHIAWTPEEEPEALGLLADLQVSLMEVAPGRLWQGDESKSTEPKALQGIKTAGIGIVGFQAILFGKPELQLFEDSTRPVLMDYLKDLSMACSLVGGKYLVFGAPKNRWIPETMSSETAFSVAVDFFSELGRHAAEAGVVIGVEANPREYGCNFCTHAADVARLVRAVNSPGVGWHLDTGELAMNKEEMPAAILDNAGLICSVHVSEPNLGDFEYPWTGHASVAKALQTISYRGTVSLEMKRPQTGLAGVRSAIEKVLEIYS